MSNRLPFPELPLDKWEPSKDTLHLYLQIVGKIALAIRPARNHWWHSTLKLGLNGLTTEPMRYGSGSVEIGFDFVDNKLVMKTHKNAGVEIPLVDGLSVAEFYRQVLAGLESLGIQVEIQAVPYDLPVKKSFDSIDDHLSYDAAYVGTYWQVLSSVGSVFQQFASRYYGKVSPVQLFWHHMDLAVTRFSGKKAPEMPAEASATEKDSYSHEVISAGFWAGDQNVRMPAFYSYTHPSPPGLETEKISPDGAVWDMSSGSPMAFLSYDVLRQLENPEAALLEFLESSYLAGAKRAKWPVEDLTYRPWD